MYPPGDPTPVVTGWHDSHCASVATVSATGEIVYAAAEERFTGNKLQKGFPARAFADLFQRFGAEPQLVAYVDQPLIAKIVRNLGLLAAGAVGGRSTEKTLAGLSRVAVERVTSAGHGDSSEYATGQNVTYDRLCEHHAAHAASAYFLSGFDEAYVVTADGVGDCVSATVCHGRYGKLRRLRQWYYNDFTAGADYETVTAMLGFNPDRHCGKITGLAAHGRHDPTCIAALESFLKNGWKRGGGGWFDRMHGGRAEETIAQLRLIRDTEFGRFSRESIAFAIQHLAEQRILSLIREHLPEPSSCNLALAGGVFANVRINQRIKQLGFKNVFVQPAMDDGGLSVGAALQSLSELLPLRPHRLPHVFLGPSFGERRIQNALDQAGVAYERTDCIDYAVARLLADGRVVARFDGAAEFGPRALGNRSILYSTQDPTVNDWLNARLGRSEFMPFAPATLAEHADRCYRGLDGCRHTAEFMTITFDCTDYMKTVSPAVVHVDGTARAQLVRSQTNPGLHEILTEYHRVTGVPSLVNTSFNMHESPIVTTPEEAIESFRRSDLDILAIGPFVARQPADADRAALQGARAHTEAAAS